MLHKCSCICNHGPSWASRKVRTQSALCQTRKIGHCEPHPNTPPPNHPDPSNPDPSRNSRGSRGPRRSEARRRRRRQGLRRHGRQAVAAQRQHLHGACGEVLAGAGGRLRREAAAEGFGPATEISPRTEPTTQQRRKGQAADFRRRRCTSATSKNTVDRVLIQRESDRLCRASMSVCVCVWHPT